MTATNITFNNTDVVDINGGTIDATIIGASSPSSITGTAITATVSTTTPSILTASGALGITPASGSNINVTLATTGDFIVNTNQLYVDTSTGFVGIGVTNPARRLEIVDVSNGANPLSLYRTVNTVANGVVIEFALQDSGNNRKVYANISGGITTNTASSEDGYMTLKTIKAGTMTEQVRITKDGYVGIGTTAPLSKLSVNGVGNSIYALYSTGDGTLIHAIGGKAGASNGWGGVFLNSSAGNEVDIAGGTYGLIVNSGNVGIGTATPNANAILDVASTTMAFMPPRMTTTQKNNIASPTAGMVVYDATTKSLNLYTTAWVEVGSAGGFSHSFLTMGG